MLINFMDCMFSACSLTQTVLSFHVNTDRLIKKTCRQRSCVFMSNKLNDLMEEHGFTRFSDCRNHKCLDEAVKERLANGRDG